MENSREKLDLFLDQMRKECEKDPPRRHLYLGQFLWIDKKYEKAIEEFHEFLKFYPDDFEANWYLGKTYFDSKQYDKVYSCFKKITYNLPKEYIEEFVEIIEQIVKTGNDGEFIDLLNDVDIFDFSTVMGCQAGVYTSSLQSSHDAIKLERTKRELEEAHRREKERMIQQYSHTLTNTLNPNAIYEVANRLKSHTEFRKDARFLTDAYHAETIIRNQGLLLQARNTGSSAEFQQLIRGDRLPEDTQEKAIGIEEILNNAVERIIARFLNSDYHKLDMIRQHICEHKQTTLSELKNSFEENVFFNPRQLAIDWASANIAGITKTLSPMWKGIRLRRDGYAEALLQGYLQELLFNALKYRDSVQDVWVGINFSDEKIDDTTWLNAKWENPFDEGKNIQLGTGKGLEGIENDIRMLNLDGGKQAGTLEVQKNPGLFSVTLHFRKDLFIPNPPIETDREKLAKALSKRREKK